MRSAGGPQSQGPKDYRNLYSARPRAVTEFQPPPYPPARSRPEAHDTERTGADVVQPRDVGPLEHMVVVA